MGEAGVRLCTQNLSEVLPSWLGCCMEGGSAPWLELHSQLSSLVWLVPSCCILLIPYCQEDSPLPACPPFRGITEMKRETRLRRWAGQSRAD